MTQTAAGSPPPDRPPDSVVPRHWPIPEGLTVLCLIAFLGSLVFQWFSLMPGSRLGLDADLAGVSLAMDVATAIEDSSGWHRTVYSRAFDQPDVVRRDLIERLGRATAPQEEGEYLAPSRAAGIRAGRAYRAILLAEEQRLGGDARDLSAALALTTPDEQVALRAAYPAFGSSTRGEIDPENPVAEAFPGWAGAALRARLAERRGDREGAEAERAARAALGESELRRWTRRWGIHYGLTGVGLVIGLIWWMRRRQIPKASAQIPPPWPAWEAIGVFAICSTVPFMVGVIAAIPPILAIFGGESLSSMPSIVTVIRVATAGGGCSQPRLSGG